MPYTLAEQIHRWLVSVHDVDVSSELVRTEDLGKDLDFSACSSTFEDFRQLASNLSMVSWARLPETTQQDVLDSLEQLGPTIREIIAFSAVDGLVKRDELQDSFREKLATLMKAALPFAGYLLWENNRPQERSLSLLKEAEDTLSSAKAIQEEVEGKRADVDAVLDAARGASAEVGVREEAGTFRKAAIEYEKRSHLWLAGSVILLAGTIAAAFSLVLLWDTSGQISDASVLQLILAKAVALAVLSYATVTAVRLFRSNAHLAAVNRHREDALRTFMTFVEGTDSPEVRDRVLLAATHAAFGQTETGLVGERSGGNNALEVVDAITGGFSRGR